MSDILQHNGVRRLVANTLNSQKRFAEAAEVTPATVADWAQATPVDTLSHFYVCGHYEVDALEALVDLHLRQRA